MKNVKKKETIEKKSQSKKSSIDKQRSSQARLTIHVSPRHIRNNTNYLKSNPTSLEKKLSKMNKKKMKQPKKFKQEPTRQTLNFSSQQNLKESLVLTFGASSQKSKKSIFNDSLKCIKELNEFNLRNASQSFMNLTKSFPLHNQIKNTVKNKQRIYLIDWLNYVSTQFNLRRNTVHLAVAFLDHYFHIKQISPGTKLQVLGAGALLLAIKQQQRGGQSQILCLLCNEQLGEKKECVLKCQSQIVLGLNFKLNYPTLPVWCDFFSQKWDKYVLNNDKNIENIEINLNKHLILIRKPQAISYRYHRQLSQLLDAIIMNQGHRSFQITKLSLAVLYLVIRINSQALMLRKDHQTSYRQYSLAFKSKSTPIFRDLLSFNAIFNDFLTETCNFQMDEIIVMIKWCSKFLDIGFTYQIDIISYQTSQNYEQFLRLSTYSEHIRNHFLQQVI